MILHELKDKGYSIVNSLSEMDGAINSCKPILVISDSASRRSTERGSFLKTAFRNVVSSFVSCSQPFFMILEGVQIDWAGHENQMTYLVRETIDLDEVVREALMFADSNGETLVIVIADHQTGGLTLLDGDISRGSVTGNFSSNDHTGLLVPVFAYGPGAETSKVFMTIPYCSGLSLQLLSNKTSQNIKK